MQAKIRIYQIMEKGRERLVDVETVRLPEYDYEKTTEENVAIREKVINEKKHQMMMNKNITDDGHKTYYFFDSKMNDNRFFNSL